MASQKFNYYQHQQTKQEKPWMRHNHSPVAVNPERVTTLLELTTEHYGKQCARCGSQKALTVHHRHYRHIGFEKPVDDVVLLCNKCHQDLHARSKAKRLHREDILFVDPNWADSLQGIAPPAAKQVVEAQKADDKPEHIWRLVFRDPEGQEWVELSTDRTKEVAMLVVAFHLRVLKLDALVSIEDVRDTATLRSGICFAYYYYPLEPHQKWVRAMPDYERAMAPYSV